MIDYTVRPIAIAISEYACGSHNRQGLPAYKLQEKPMDRFPAPCYHWLLSLLLSLLPIAVTADDAKLPAESISRQELSAHIKQQLPKTVDLASFKIKSVNKLAMPMLSAHQIELDIEAVLNQALYQASGSVDNKLRLQEILPKGDKLRITAMA